jgi:aldose 1-epimerase
MPNISPFGTLQNGATVDCIRLERDGMVAHVLTYGAVLQSLMLAGQRSSVVLGFSDIASYESSTGYLGAIVGRCANRICDGQFEISGQSYQVDQNSLNQHTLHGGADGTDRQIWTILDHSADRVSLQVTLPDGHMGFPGNLQVTATYRILPQGVLDLQMSAQSDAVTICNLAPHHYFNLAGGGTIYDHSFQINADHYLPVDDDLIPTGEVRAVQNTPFDFRTKRPIGDFYYDHNFCVTEPSGTLAEICTLQAGRTSMRILSTERGLQVYSGSGLDEAMIGGYPQKFIRGAGLALEPQNWPDAINHANFPDPLLRPDQTYFHHTQFVFAQNASAAETASGRE